MLEHDIWKIIDRTETNVLADNFNERYNTNFADGKFRIAIFKIDSDQKNTSENSNTNQFPSFLANIKEKYKDLFEEFIIISNDFNDRAIALFNYNEKKLAEIESSFRNVIVSFNSSADIGNSELTIGLGCETSNLGTLANHTIVQSMR